ncbi:hypothetical protein CN581_04050 [Bacillus toyonensis]|uniref:class I adenylate-forming enzyme family protein n=1 Tax=Bacillus toyonensis TaxID=155322 RepID=UPI000BF92B57|nr:class I adenylate-forming enzyme family protein [Bacillus toyonensis]PEP83748.1 hypothetical protein CN581_04050 [Bacillus toyonensis]
MGYIKTLLKKQIALKKEAAVINEEFIYSPTKVIKEMDVISNNFKHFKKGEKIGLVVDHSLRSLMILLTIIEQEYSLLPLDSKCTVSEIERVKKVTETSVWIIPDTYNYESLSTSSCYTYSEVYSEQLKRPNNNYEAESESLYMLTSGTSGITKIAKIPYYSLWRGAESYRDWFDIKHTDTIISTVPLTHSYGLIGACLTSIFSQATLYLCKNPTPRKVINAVHASKSTILFGVPVFYNILTQAQKITKIDLETLRLIISSGGPLDNIVKGEFFRKFGLPIQQVYGSTETGAIAATHPVRKSSLNAVGYILPNVKVETSNNGCLKVQSHTVFNGYLTEVGEHSLVINRTFKTGDYGYVKNGEVFLKGRAKTFINVGGRKINPTEIERALVDHPYITDSRVLGEVDTLYGERIVAYVQAQSEYLTIECVKEFLERRLAEYKLPHQIKIVQEISKSWKEKYIEGDRY